MPDSKKILDEILRAAVDARVNGSSVALGTTGRPLAVFDLDSTLFNVSGRSQRIVRDFCELPEVVKMYPQDVERLKLIQFESGDWGIKEAIVRQGWAAPPAFFIAVRDFWRTHFFSNEYLIYDKPYPGALEYVRAIAAAGIEIKYLTGRDRPDMFKGTVASLKQWGFPLSDDASELYMKPAKGSSEDEDYKTQVMLQFQKTFSKVFFFENEPVIINKVLIAAPSVRIVFLDTVHSRQAIVPPHIPVIRAFHTGAGD